MAPSNRFLRIIRNRFNVPAYHNVAVKTLKGEGVIHGADGFMLRVWFPLLKKFEYFSPDEVVFL